VRLLTRLQNGWSGLRAGLGIGAELPGSDDDYWFTSRSYRSSAGAYVSPESAMRLSAVFACVRVVSETIGSLPLVIYRRRADGGKERANDHPLSSVLQKPNPWQTSFEFWEMMQGHLELRGNSYAQIVSGNSHVIDQLIPLHPDRVRVFRLPNGRLRYEVVSYFDATIQKLTQDEVFHLRGLSSDGIMGTSTISAAAEVIGVGLAQQEHRAKSFANRAIPGLYLKPATKMDGEARENLQKSIKDGFSGANAFKAMVGIPGMDVTQLGITNRDAQLIEASNATRTDIASMFRLPPHKIGDLTRGTFSNIEQQNIEFATDSIRPRVVRLERRIDADLIEPLTEGMGGAPGEYFAVYDMDALFRGDMKSRYDAYNLALQYWTTVNEVRAREGLNPIPGGDEILRPANMLPANAEPSDQSTNADMQEQIDDSGSPGSEPDPADENAKNARVRELAAAAAGRVVRREVKGLRKLVARGLPESHFSTEVRELYSGLPALITESLVLPAETATRYCDGHCTLINSVKPASLGSTIDTIEEESPAVLANLAVSGCTKHLGLQELKS
jgi:HK97 family phage portal protein